MAKVFKEKGSRKVWVLRFCWKDKNLSNSYTIQDTRKGARVLKKNLSGMTEMGVLKIHLHKGLQNVETGALMVGSQKYY